MKFKICSIAIFFISLSVVPILLNANKADTENSNEIKKLELEKRQMTKAEEDKLFNLYSAGKVKGEPPSTKIVGGPIYFQGWLKFFHYNNGIKSDRPTDFFQNNAYYVQRVLKDDKDRKDDIGPLNISTKFHFFASLSRDVLSILSSRKELVQKVVDSLQVDLIDPIPKDKIYKGGVKDLGQFDEGNCFQVATTVPVNSGDTEFDNMNDPGEKQNWVFCMDRPGEKKLLMKQLVKIKLLKQKIRGQEVNVKKPFKITAKNFLKAKKQSIIEHYNGPGKDLRKDGFWLRVQDWSPCSLKCGGGVATQHWICHPPKKGGKPCQGSGIRTKPCNLQPCPKITGYGDKKKQKEEIFKPIVKSLPWSSRKQRYIECEVKETDVLYIRRDAPGKEGEDFKYPGRMVMNNRTISLYEDDSFDKNLFTFNIRDADVGYYEKDYCCLIVQSLDKKFRACGFSGECGTKENPVFVKEWLHAFNLFSKKCYVDLPRRNWKDAIKEDENDGGKGPKIDMPGLAAREAIIKRKIREKEEMDIQRKITTTQDLALKAIRKELKLERLVKKEERIKEEQKVKDLMKLKIKEEKKKECLVKALKDREEINNKGRTSKEAELEIARIKIEAKKDVAQERLNLRKKIADIKKVSKRRQKMLEQQISLIRSSMAKDLLDANKNGDIMLCKNGLKDPEKAILYCNQNFVTNYNMNTECKDMDRFCPICCENEFGNLFLNKREECYAICDAVISSQLKGDFIWDGSFKQMQK